MVGAALSWRLICLVGKETVNDVALETVLVAIALNPEFEFSKVAELGQALCKLYCY